MSRIFVSFFNAIIDPNNKDAMPCFYDAFLNSLKNSGNDVLYYSNIFFNKNINKTPKDFLDKINIFNPDLIILFNNACFDISDEFDCPILIWEVDSYFYFSNIDKIKLNPNRYKYIVPQNISIEKIRDFFGVNSKNIYLLPPSSSVIAQKIKQKSNITFIGTKFGTNNIVSKFINSEPDENEIAQYKKILKYIEDYPFSTDKYILKNFKVNSDKIKKYLSIKNIVEDISAKNRIQTLSAVADLGLSIYGTESWKNNLEYNPELYLSYKNKLVYSLKHNQDIYNSSKIGININHVQAQDSFSFRVCDIMASNACLVTQPRKELNRLFPKIKIPTYNNPYEAYIVCKKLLNNTNLREDIVLSCQETIDNHYRFKHRIKDLEGITNIPLFSKNNGSLTKLVYKTNSTTTENVLFTKKIKTNLRIKIRSKLMLYSILMFINQIPMINKILMSRGVILDKIKETIDNE